MASRKDLLETAKKDLLEVEPVSFSAKSPMKLRGKKDISKSKDDEDVSAKSPLKLRGKKDVSYSEDDDVSAKSPRKLRSKKDVSESKDGEDISAKTTIKLRGKKSTKQKTRTPKKPKKEYPCFACSEVFHETKDLFEHTCGGKASKGFLCKFCEKIYELRSTYINHQRVHTRVKPFKCAECGSRYASQSERIAHMKRWHLEMEPYPCPVRNCEYSFSSNKKLVFHSKKVHNANRCKYCGEKFDTPVKLQRHRCNKHEK